MNMTEIVLKVLESNPNAKSFRFKTRTTPKLTKKNRTTGEATDFTLVVESEFTASLGVNYQDEVNNAREAIGEDTGFTAQKPTGKHYVNGTNWLMEADNAPGKFYVAMCRFANRTTRYLVNDQELTPERLEYVKANYMQKSGPAPLVEWKTYLVESIVSAEPVPVA